MEPAEEGNAAGRGSLAVVGEPVLALVRRLVSRPSRAGAKGRCHVKLVRYADDFVALAKQMGSETIEFIESRFGARGK